MNWKNWQTALKRKVLQVYRRTVTEKATPEFIARGWAIGMFYGCLVPFGLQICLSVPTTLWLKGSKTGAICGTFITNPFSVFVIYPVQCYLGLRCMGGANHSYRTIEKALAGVLRDQNWQALSGVGGELIIAFFIGGALLALIMTPLTYYSIRFLVVRHRAKLARRKARLVDQRSGA